MPSAPRLVYLCLQDVSDGTPAGTHVRGIQRGLESLGVDVRLAAPSDRLPGLSPLRRLLPSLATILRCLGMLVRADVLMVRAHPLALPAALGARLIGKTVLQEVNGQARDALITHRRFRAIGPAIMWMQHIQYRLADHLVGVTPGIVDWLGTICPGRAAALLVPNGVDTDIIHPPQEPVAASGQTVVMVSSFSRWHGIETLLEATRDPAWPQDVTALLIGDGPEHIRLHDRLSTASNIKMVGRQQPHTLASWFAGAIAGLVLIEDPEGRSSTGTAPLKLYETMAAGVAVIATEQPFQSDVVREAGAGLIIPPENPVALAEAVATLAADRECAASYGKSARESAVRNHDWRNRAVLILELLQNGTR